MEELFQYSAFHNIIYLGIPSFECAHSLDLDIDAQMESTRTIRVQRIHQIREVEEVFQQIQSK